MAPRPPRGGPHRRKEPDWDDFVLPLPRTTARKIEDARKRPSDGNNVGLWLDKLVWRMKGDFHLQAEHRSFALNQLCRPYRSEAGAAAVLRLRESARRLHGDAFVRVFRAKVDGRLLVGYGRANAVETALTFHRSWGTPLIPGSALKGITRARVTRRSEMKNEDITRCFGEQKQGGRLVFYDALPEDGQFELALDVLTPHMGEYYEGREPPADWLSPTPHTFLTVVRTTFVFVVGVQLSAYRERAPEGNAEGNARWDLKQGVDALQKALEEDGVGVKTAAGYGRFEGFQAL